MQGSQFLWHPTVHAKVLAAYETSNRKLVKHIHYPLVDFYIVPILNALLSEIESLSHLACFMISAQQDNIVGVLQLKGNQQTNYFWTVEPTIDVVTKKDIFYFIGQL